VVYFNVDARAARAFACVFGIGTKPERQPIAPDVKKQNVLCLGQLKAASSCPA
jgi:hypothetical protein